MPDGVLLIPGFFGFGTFGAHRPTPIRYFDHVTAALEAERPDLRGYIHPTEPAPTGSLAARVEHLSDAVAGIFAHGIGPEHRPIARLHMIGHSAGGVCARLLTNRHHWTGNLHSDIGSVVTVAAPLHGTPLAAQLAGEFALSLPGLSLLSIVAKAREIMPLPRARARDLLVAEIVRRRTVPNDARLALLFDLDPVTAGEIARFLDHVVHDHALLHDLEPAPMRELNTRIAGGDHPGLRHVVTVAPPPPLLNTSGGIVGEVFRLIYAILYEATADRTFAPARFPTGPWLDGSSPALAATPAANDGVVPSSSQALTATAHAIVEADHLDVVGHFRSRRFRSTTVLRSGAEFDDVDFQQLWSTVGGMLR
jgi:hypothetical protein